MKRKAAIATIAYLALGGLFILTGEKAVGVLCIVVAGFSVIAGLEAA